MLFYTIYDFYPEEFFFVGHSYQNQVVRSSVTDALIIEHRLHNGVNTTFDDVFSDEFTLKQGLERRVRLSFGSLNI